MPHQSHVNRAGFTIVEQLVALVVLGVGLLVIAQGVVSLQRYARRAGLRLDATAAASSAVERMSAMSCSAAVGTDTAGRVTVRWTRGGQAPGATITARAAADVDGRPARDSLSSARDCRPGS